MEEEKNASPIHIRKLTPIQMPHVDIVELKEARKHFTQEEWMEIMLRSCGYEPDSLNERERWLLLARMLPLVENNFNLCELDQEVLVSLIFTRKFHPTVFLSLEVRQQ